MNFKRSRTLHSEVSTGALTDIMFFLLLFFLIVSTVTNPNVIKLLLPNSSSSKSISKQTIPVSITKDLKFYIHQKPILKENITSQIEQEVSQLPEATIVLRVEQGVPIENVVDIMDIGLKLKIKVVLATQRKD